ncbi:MAG: NAD(P)/FAD-dependent oxidoreductase [Clostridiales bacterium]|nr:NAD(P)/FAD-dependent oxidoreductase [Clostridiales bacterium]
MQHTYDCIIIGAGPAGISAALYTLRANLKTLILRKGGGALERAEQIDNYYGFPQGIPGAQLLQNGEQQALRLGADLLDCEVTKLMPGPLQEVTTTAGVFTAPALLLATGTGRKRPAGFELESFEGRGVSYCAICDGFFHRGKDVAVLGTGEYARAEARELAAFAGSVTLLTNGAPLETDMGEIPVLTERIDGLESEQPDGPLTAVRFKDGSRQAVSGLFIAIGTASASDMARSAGIVTGPKGIVTDPSMQTNLKGVFAAGDCVGGLFQIAKAVGEGAVAGVAMAEFVRSQKKG